MVREVELVLTIVYSGVKASTIITDDSSFQLVLNTLREDLTFLGIAHPKALNIRVPANGTVQFSWITTPNSTLHNGVRMKKNQASSADLQKLSIASFRMEELSPPRPGTERVVPPGGSHSVRSNSTQSSSVRSRSPARQRPAPYPTPHISPRMSAAENFLNTVDLRTPTASSSTLSVEKQQAAENSFSSNSAVYRRVPEPPQPVQSTSFYRRRLSPARERRDSAASIASSTRRTPSPTRVAETTQRPMDVDTPVVPTLPQKPGPVSASPAINNTTPRAFQVPHPKQPADIQIRKLTQELRDVREQVRKGLARENAILKNLRQLEATDVPESSLSKINNDFLMKTQLEMIEAELDAEKKLRLDAEAVLNDIRNECKEPFVVPALLDAFITITHLTDSVAKPIVAHK